MGMNITMDDGEKSSGRINLLLALVSTDGWATLVSTPLSPFDMDLYLICVSFNT